MTDTSAQGQDATELLAALRRAGGEPETVEVKSGAGGFPTSIRETLVAFANTEGGTVIIGVDERAGFAIVDLPDVVGYRDRLVGLARDAITPPLTISTDIVEVESKLVLVAEVPKARADQRPVFVTSKGVPNGAYLRAGDGDRRMTGTEIALTIAARTQPQDDREPVDGSSLADLDRDAMLRTLQRARSGSVSLRSVSDVVALRRLGVLVDAREDSAVTLGGILAFGEYPQQYFPQLMASVVVHPPEGETDVRFLDNVTLRGSIPEIVQDGLAVIRRNLAARAVMGDSGRTERLDYPIEAIREAFVNALLHRDYSPATRGTQVQVDLYPDRLVIRNPGGLFGGLSIEELGEEGVSSSRNSVLASLLSDTYLPGSNDLVAENRASGIPAMIALARSRGLPRPAFASTITTFKVTMGRSELLGPEVRSWIASLGASLPTPTHDVALAMMRTGPVTNEMLREWGADRILAGQVLRDLVEQGLAVKEGGRRYAQYVLDPARLTQRPTRPTAPVRPAAPPARGARATTELVADEMKTLGTATAFDLEILTGFSRPTVVAHLRALIEQGVVAAEGAPRSPKRRYRWTGGTGEDHR